MKTHVTICAVLLLLAGYVTIVTHCAACAPTAETAYTAALLRCVDKAETIAESRACRSKVDDDYGVKKDGGK